MALLPGRSGADKAKLKIRLFPIFAFLGVLASNTPHRVFDALQRYSPPPLISIVEVTRDAAAKQGLKRLGLLNTRFQ